MTFRYQHQGGRLSPLDLKYQEYNTNTVTGINKGNEENFQVNIDYLENKNAEIKPNVDYNPNFHFIEQFNKRKTIEWIDIARKNIESEFDSNGNRLACIWKKDGFAEMHDSLSIFKKKGNFEDLAWKIHRDVEDKNIFLKTLYFPKLITEDYMKLTKLFEEKSASFHRQKFFSYGIVFGVAGLTWGMAYRNNFKIGGFVILTGGTFFVLKYFVDRHFLNSLNWNLNFQSRAIAEKYPEIKYLSIEYVKSS